MERLGKYQLLSRLASGGMAVTWRAQLMGAAGVTKPVAVKVIHPHLASDARFVEMFIDEARIASLLSHGNIAQVFDFGREGDTHYLAMELIDGQSLGAVIRRARQFGYPQLPVPIALHIAMKMCAGLHHAHTLKTADGSTLDVVHRDISPDNVMVSYDGQVKLVDFGIARARNRTAQKTDTGAVKGKLPYFSPEQAQLGPMDRRSDVFSTGVVLYEMACGARPVEGELLVAIPKLLQGDWALPSSRNSRLAGAPEAALLKAMAVERDGRFASARDFEAALALCLSRLDPTFSGERLSRFMELLFAGELAAEGRAAPADAELIRWLAQWGDARPKFADDGPTDRDLSPPEVGDPDATQPLPMRAPPAPTKAWRWRVAVAVAALLVALPLALGELGTWVWAELTGAPTPRIAVVVRSNPAGARVTVDGAVMPGATPLVLSDLPAGQALTVIVEAKGHRPWLRRMTFDQKTHTVDAVLEAESPP